MEKEIIKWQMEIIKKFSETANCFVEINKRLFPSKEKLADMMATQSDDFLFGIYYYGSKTGKELSRNELVARGKLKEIKFPFIGKFYRKVSGDPNTSMIIAP